MVPVVRICVFCLWFHCLYYHCVSVSFHFSSLRVSFRLLYLFVVFSSFCQSWCSLVSSLSPIIFTFFVFDWMVICICPGLVSYVSLCFLLTVLLYLFVCSLYVKYMSQHVALYLSILGFRIILFTLLLHVCVFSFSIIVSGMLLHWSIIVRFVCFSLCFDHRYVYVYLTFRNTVHGTSRYFHVTRLFIVSLSFYHHCFVFVLMFSPI